nr:mucin-5AC-like protein [uncultured bacterium]
MVDPSLLRQAADRGVTICFADLDGADGLWVPEERTVLVNRGLSEAAVAEVIRHELAHVAIDDQHAELDAGREVLVGRPPARRTGPLAVVLAAAGLVAVVGGVAFGLSRAGAPDGEQLVRPAPSGQLTASEDGGEVPQPGTTVVVTRDAEGRVVTRTVVLTVSPPPPTATAGSLTPTATATPARTPQRSAGPAPVVPAPTRSAPPSASPSSAGPAPTPTPAPTTAAPTSVVPTPTPTGGGEPAGGGPVGGGPVGGGPLGGPVAGGAGTDGSASGTALGTPPASPATATATGPAGPTPSASG